MRKLLSILFIFASCPLFASAETEDEVGLIYYLNLQSYSTYSSSKTENGQLILIESGRITTSDSRLYSWARQYMDQFKAFAGRYKGDGSERDIIKYVLADYEKQKHTVQRQAFVKKNGIFLAAPVGHRYFLGLKRLGGADSSVSYSYQASEPNEYGEYTIDFTVNKVANHHASSLLLVLMDGLSEDIAYGEDLPNPSMALSPPKTIAASYLCLSNLSGDSDRNGFGYPPS